MTPKQLHLSAVGVALTIGAAGSANAQPGPPTSINFIALPRANTPACKA